MAMKKPLPLALTIALDTVFFAGSLLGFAYFHHVNPLIKEKVETRRAASRDVDIYGTTAPASAQTGTSASQSAGTAAESGTSAAGTETVTAQSDAALSTDAAQSSGSTDGSRTEAAADPGSTAQTQTAAQNTAAQSAVTTADQADTEQPTAAATSKSTTTATTAATTTGPQYDTSGWGAKWPELFSIDDTVEADDDHYRSHDVYIAVSSDNFSNSDVHICDIYIRKFDSFKTAFEHDEFKNGPQENMYDLAERKNAILAINGDFTGGRENGVIIRDGQLYRDVVRGDIGALFDDGTFRSFSKNEVTTDWLLDNYVYDTMTFGPALVRDGAVCDGSDWSSQLVQSHPRSGFGYYEPGHYCFVAVDGRGMNGSQGITAAEFADYMCNTLHCAEAYNLDGGQSSQLWFNGKIINSPDRYNGKKESLRGLVDIFYIGEAE